MTSKNICTIMPSTMSLPKFIRDNTNDGHNIARVLIDVMEGRFEGTKISHRLTAARLLTIYGNDDAPDFIADNTPDTSETERGEKIWFTIDPGLRTLIRARTDDGRVICIFLIDVMEGSETERGEKIWFTIDPGLRTLIRARTDDGRVICIFLIDVMEGRVEGIHVGHRVSAAKELLNRAFGKSQSRDLPKPPGSKTPRRSTKTTRRKHAMTPEAAAFEARVAERIAASKSAPHSDTVAAQSEPTLQPESEANDNFDPDVYRGASRCIDPNFDPMLAATNDDYFWNYDGCDDTRCPYHGDPEEFDFDPIDDHY